MPKKALDSRIPTLIRNNVQTHQRSIFIVVGDQGREQVVHLHHILSLSRVSARPNVLPKWYLIDHRCYGCTKKISLASLATNANEKQN
jgi:tRNA(Met) cytidine acetyltransferase TmcA, N-terminal